MNIRFHDGKTVHGEIDLLMIFISPVSYEGMNMCCLILTLTRMMSVRNQEEVQ